MVSILLHRRQVFCCPLGLYADFFLSYPTSLFNAAMGITKIFIFKVFCGVIAVHFENHET